MIGRYFTRFGETAVVMHADPIAALAALKLASLALQSTNSPRYWFPSRAVRDQLDSTHHSRSL